MCAYELSGGDHWTTATECYGWVQKVRKMEKDVTWNLEKTRFTVASIGKQYKSSVLAFIYLFIFDKFIYYF